MTMNLSMLQHPSFIHHPLSDQDRAVVDAMRAASAPFKGLMTSPAARESYDQMMEATPAAPGVNSQTATLNGVAGVWCRPQTAPHDAAILYLHGGGYVVGSAQAYRHFAGQFAARTGLAAFVADYRLAPEHPFPAALQDALAAYAGLVEAGYTRIVVVGDSAGGGLSLALVAHLARQVGVSGDVQPRACVAMSPWTDLTLSGASHQAQADQELYLTRAAMQDLSHHYLAGGEALQPDASPLFGDLRGLPPLHLQVGTDEILLSDTLNYSSTALSNDVAITTHVWDGMPHVFPSSFVQLVAAESAMQQMADFIRSHA
jgi:monoterpene epsilon-lactone hydrolase